MKKMISAAAALATAAAAICTPVLSAKDYTVSDLRGLSGSILGNAPLKEEQDVNNDGVINSFDLAAMRRTFRSTGVFSESTLPASEENVRLTGRYYLDDGTTWLVQSGSAAEFTVNARSAEVTIKGDKSTSDDENYRPRYAILIDGEVVLDATVGKEEETVSLFSGDTARTATVKVIHLSEANNGAVGITGIKTDSDVKAPLSPTAEKELHIEFIGDSITCGYGVEGSSAYESFKTTTENFMKSYAYLTAQKLGADYSAVSYSGHGIISGYTSDGTKNTDSLVPPYYEYIGKSAEYNIKWDFESHQNDVVVINLGTNDSSYITGDGFEEKAEEYAEEYEKFLETVRKNNPQAYIICTLGTMGGTDLYPYIEKAIASFKESTGDERITSYLSAVQSPDNGYGSDWHPSEVTQQKSAYVLADKICQALGMQSDQIGLDVAADAQYSLSIAEDSGANAATYFSDYDKSFWINMVSGGSSPEDVEAVAAGIGLRKGGVYRLSFSCTTTDGTELPILIRSADGKQIYFSDTFKAEGEKTPYSTEFTAPADDTSAQFVLQVGGTDYYSVTLYGLQLEKIG